MSSPLYLDGLLYFTSDSDFITCIDTKDGQEIWKERIGGRHYASLLHAGNALYVVADNGRTLALAPGRKFQILGEGTLSEGSRSSLAVAGNALLLRTYDAIVRIGNR